MIVVDTNTSVYLRVPSPGQATVENLLRSDSNRMAPPLWRSEFRNALVTYMRAGYYTVNQSMIPMAKAEEFMMSHEKSVNSPTVLRLAEQCQCTPHNCEFVALALDQEVPLITHNKKILKESPSMSMTAEQFLAQKS